MNYIKLPSWVKPLAEIHATSVVEDELGLSEDSVEYDKEFEKAFYNFCNEFYTHSLIPYAANPSPVAKNVFNAFKDIFSDGPHSWLSSRIQDQKMRKLFESRLVKAVNALAKIYMYAEVQQTKTGYNQAKDLQDPEQRKTTILHNQRIRNIRLIVTSLLLGSIYQIFKLDKNQLESLIDQNLVQGKLSFREMNSTKFQTQLARMVVSSLVANYGETVVQQSVEEALKNYHSNKERK